MFIIPSIAGDEAAAIITAPAAALVESYYPLINPPTLDKKKTNVPRLWGNLAPWFSIPSAWFGLPQATSQIPEGYKLDSSASKCLHYRQVVENEPLQYTFGTDMAHVTQLAAAHLQSLLPNFTTLWLQALVSLQSGISSFSIHGHLSSVCILSRNLSFLRTKMYCKGEEILTPFGRGQVGILFLFI